MDFFSDCVQKGKVILALWKLLQDNFNWDAESLNLIYNLFLSDQFCQCSHPSPTSTIYSFSMKLVNEV